MKPSGFGADDVHLTSKEKVYSGFLKVFKYTLSHKLFRGGYSKPLVREAIVRPPSVGVLLFDPVNNAVVMVEQIRMGSLLAGEEPWMLEVVAGISEPEEALEEVAIREVFEETGYEVSSLMTVADFYLSPGASTEKLKLFCAFVDSSHAGGVFGLPEEGEEY